MYKEFYGLTAYPFALDSDTEFLYPSENYQHCLSCLFDGLERQYEFLVMTGDVGAGKTFLLNTLVKSLDEKTHVAFLDHSKFNSINLLQYVSQEFGLEPAGKSKFELLLNLKNSLLDEKAILIIDEAENLSVDILEELRLLTDFENYEKTLVQIILAGQLQLEEMLKLPELTQLSHRVEFVCSLLPMNYHETKCYVEARLAIAGFTSHIFTSEAIQEIFVHSRGIPKIINIICHVALLRGFHDKEREIGGTVIKQVVKGLHLDALEKSMSHHSSQRQDVKRIYTDSFRRPSRLALVVSIAVFSLLGAGVVLQSSLASRKLREYTTRSVPSPSVVLPLNSVFHEEPILPHNPVFREEPILPQGTYSR